MENKDLTTMQNLYVPFTFMAEILHRNRLITPPVFLSFEFKE